jgi:glucokinase
MNESYAIGVDIGGTNMSAAVMSHDNSALLSKETIETRAQQGPEDGMKRLGDLIARVIQAANISLKDVAGIGIGCSGPVDTEKGLVQNPYTLPTWDDLPIVEILTGRFHKPILLLNDAHAAALGEYHVGAGRGSRNMIYMTVSTGIGGGLILNGQLYRSKGLMAGEIGHQSVDYDGRPCYCGARGCLEMYAAGPGIAQTAQERITPDSAIWSRVDGDKQAISARIVGEAAQAGDALALDILREAGMYLGVGIANLINILAPERIVIGGGVMQSHAFIFPALHEHLGKQKFLVPADDIQILRAELGLDAGVVGAAHGILRYLDKRL